MRHAGEAVLNRGKCFGGGCVGMTHRRLHAEAYRFFGGFKCALQLGCYCDYLHHSVCVGAEFAYYLSRRLYHALFVHRAFSCGRNAGAFGMDTGDFRTAGAALRLTCDMLKGGAEVEAVLRACRGCKRRYAVRGFIFQCGVKFGGSVVKRYSVYAVNVSVDEACHEVHSLSVDNIAAVKAADIGNFAVLYEQVLLFYLIGRYDEGVFYCYRFHFPSILLRFSTLISTAVSTSSIPSNSSETYPS